MRHYEIQRIGGLSPPINGRNLLWEYDWPGGSGFLKVGGGFSAGAGPVAVRVYLTPRQDVYSPDVNIHLVDEQYDGSGSKLYPFSAPKARLTVVVEVPMGTDWQVNMYQLTLAHTNK